MAKGKSKGKKKAKEQAKASPEKQVIEEKPDKNEPIFDQTAKPDAIADASSLPDEETLFELAELYKIFADTTRLKILYALMGEGMCVADIAEFAGVTQSAVSHQLRSMKQAHLVTFKREGKQVAYKLAGTRVQAILAQGLAHFDE